MNAAEEDGKEGMGEKNKRRKECEGIKTEYKRQMMGI